MSDVLGTIVAAVAGILMGLGLIEVFKTSWAFFHQRRVLVSQEAEQRARMLALLEQLSRSKP